MLQLLLQDEIAVPWIASYGHHCKYEHQWPEQPQKGLKNTLQVGALKGTHSFGVSGHPKGLRLLRACTSPVGNPTLFAGMKGNGY